MQRRLVLSSGDITSFYDGRSGSVGSSLRYGDQSLSSEDRGVGADRPSHSRARATNAASPQRGLCAAGWNGAIA
jgi:hypothetical protein